MQIISAWCVLTRTLHGCSALTGSGDGILNVTNLCEWWIANRQCRWHREHLIAHKPNTYRYNAAVHRFGCVNRFTVKTCSVRTFFSLVHLNDEAFAKIPIEAHQILFNEFHIWTLPSWPTGSPLKDPRILRAYWPVWVLNNYVKMSHAETGLWKQSLPPGRADVFDCVTAFWTDVMWCGLMLVWQRKLHCSYKAGHGKIQMESSY